MPQNKKSSLALLSASVLLASATAFVAPAQAGLMHKHPTATGIGAGMVAHHMAKHAHGGFMHKHPVMTGVGAGMIAHHMAKHHG